jgi:hypothetical protein
MSVVGDSGSAQMRQESSPTVKMLRPMLGHGTQVRQRSIGEQTSGSLVDKEQAMNERIRQLAEQAGIPAIDGVWDYNDRNLLVKDGGEWRTAVPSEIIGTMINSEKGLEKFAELIIRECMEQLNISNVPTSISAGLNLGRVAIKEHFGVEE